MVSTFLDLWKRWRGANWNLILIRGKGVPAGGQGPFHARSARRCPSHPRAARHAGAWRTCRGHSSRWRQMTGTRFVSLRLCVLPLNTGPWTSLTGHVGSGMQAGPAGPPTRSGRVNARAGKPVDSALLFSLPRLLMHRMTTLTVKSNEYYGKWPLGRRSTYEEKNKKMLRYLSIVYTAQRRKHSVLSFRDYIWKQDSH